jgi:hypothetical protein
VEAGGLGASTVKYHHTAELRWISHCGGARHMVNHVFALDGRVLTETEWIALAVILKAKGMDVLPACTHHNHLGHCKGHPE